MKVKAKLSFSGLISMHTGQEREIENEVILKDLIEAGYVEPVSIPVILEDDPQAEDEKAEDEKAEEKPVKKTTATKRKA